MFYLIFAMICLSVTFIGAICGVGGGVILKPVLDALSGYSIAQINLICCVTVLAMTLASLASSGEMRKELGKGRMPFVLLGATLGGLLGKALLKALLARANDGALIGCVQNVLLILLTLGTLWYELNRPKIRTRHVRNPWAVAGVSLLLGSVSAFLGIGGGPFNLIVLMHCFSMDAKAAAASSLGIILFSQGMSLAETLALGQAPPMPVGVLAVGAAAGVAGGLIGRFASRRIDERQVDRLFLGLLLVIIFICAGNIAKFTFEIWG